MKRKLTISYLAAAFLTHCPAVSRFLPDRAYVKAVYKGYVGKRLNLQNPSTFNEKIQWLKLYDHKPEYTSMVDKIEVKKFVKETIGEEYLIPTLGVWDRFEDIDFSTLPNQFVLKCSHDSGGLVICRDKSILDIDKTRKIIDRSLKKNFFLYGREWPYKNVKPRILAEKYMQDIASGSEGLTDYKFFCFNGKAKLLYISKGLEDHRTAEMSFYGLDGIEMPYHRSDYKPLHNAVLPKNFTDMIIVAEKLACRIDSPFIRIDLYSINGGIYFSEITFSPCGGMVPFEPEEGNEELGRYFQLPHFTGHNEARRNTGSGY